MKTNERLKIKRTKFEEIEGIKRRKGVLEFIKKENKNFKISIYYNSEDKEESLESLNLEMLKAVAEFLIVMNYADTDDIIWYGNGDTNTKNFAVAYYIDKKFKNYYDICLEKKD